MKVGDKVIVKGYDEEATIICVYAVPKDWDLVDVKFDNGDVVRGISTEIISEVKNNVSA